MLGTLGSALSLARLTIGRAKPGMTKPGARSEAWKWFRYSLVPVAGGSALLAFGSKADSTRWLAIIVTFAVVFWDLGLWLRSHRRRKSDGPTVEPS